MAQARVAWEEDPVRLRRSDWPVGVSVGCVLIIPVRWEEPILVGGTVSWAEDLGDRKSVV